MAEMSDLNDVLESLEADTPYARGVLDVLRLSGLVRLAGGKLEPADEVAGMLIDSLRAHLADGVVVGIEWGDLDAEGFRGVDLLKAIEAARIERVDEPTPGRIVQVTQGIIKARRGDQDVYLMQYDAHAGRYQPIGGKKDPEDADTAEALRREMMEELGLDSLPGPDQCTLTLVKADWRTTTISATYGIVTAYAMDFYHVHDLTFEVPTDADTRWISREEIATEQASDGRPISTVYQDALGLAALDALTADS
ncbi:MAG: NUDIX domain-containing protein [Anaerolineae bacterium]|nr:NUDIX domain-containing protein [Anaerolineae bacterium]